VTRSTAVMSRTRTNLVHLYKSVWRDTSVGLVVAADISFSARPLPHPTPRNSPLRTRADSAVWLALGFIVIWSLFWVTVEIISFRVGVETKVRRCIWHSAGSLGWPFPALNKIEIKYTEAILSNSTRKLSWFEVTKMPIAV